MKSKLHKVDVSKFTRKNWKGISISKLVARYDVALKEEFYIEAFIIGYALLENRLRSTLENINAVPEKKIGFDAYITALKTYKENHDIKNILDEYVTIKLFDELNDWRKLRNDVTYKLTDSDEEYKKVEELALKGRELFRVFSNKIMLVKKKLKKKKLLKKK